MTGDKLRRPVLFLTTEFIVIVLGVLVALGVDEWRDARERREIRDQLIAGLIADLEGDRRDYEQVRDMARKRLAFSRALLTAGNGDISAPGEAVRARVAGNPASTHLDPGETLGDALYGVGTWNRLETNLGAFSEMTTSGSGLSIEDTELRLQISGYYARAINRADLNDLLEENGSRFNDRLHELGFSPSERDSIDIEMVLEDRQILAAVRTIEASSPYIERVSQELLDANAELLAWLREVHDAN